MEDDILKDEVDGNLPIEDDEVDGKKKLLDDDVDSADDLADDELAIDKEDLMDDIEEM